MKICIAGKSYIAVEALFYTIEKYSGIDICVIPNRSDKSENTWEPSLKKMAEARGIEILDIDDLYQIEELIFISLEFDRIIDPGKFNTGNLYNIHFSLLPAYKGVYTSAMPILNSESMSGVTLHKIDEGIDTGAIVDQKKFDLDVNETALSLYLKYNTYGLLLFKKNIDRLINGCFSLEKQSPIKASYYSKKAIDYSCLSVDLNKTAFEINKQIRAFNFRAYQLPKVYDYKISHSKILDKRSANKPGMLIDEFENHMVISTVDYDLELFKDGLAEAKDCVKTGNIQKLKKLANSGYNLFEKFEYGWDLGIIAAYQGSWEIFKYLIDSGYNIFSKNANGTNLLMYTISSEEEKGKQQMIKYLIEQGLSASIKDFSGKSTLDWLNEYKRKDLIRSIEEITNLK